MTTQLTTRIPQQARSIEKRNRLMDAAMLEFEAQGFHGTNAKKIAAAAGVSIGTFYAYFPDKKAILLEIINHHLFEVDQSIFPLLAQKIQKGITGREIVQHIIRLGHESHSMSSNLLRVMLSMRYIDEDFQELATKEREDIIQKLSQFFTSINDHLRVTDMDAAAAIVANAFEETLHSVALDTPSIEQGRLYAALADMTSRYLFINPDELISFENQKKRMPPAAQEPFEKGS
ncbi:TetR/AcrR family transcriptional regulator [Pseudodesulfovibrio sp. JC047]|uniref:TetR/AcrR family transcriptional regulator n=1 Tax=Pseudodesulfovibrio sp. JC047 TaxID=2683199 RepID=UPI0013D15CDD|nr:TetR/AcrR family transcriptional regulator [Pseudodesulfovibrio sp. JC047]